MIAPDSGDDELVDESARIRAQAEALVARLTTFTTDLQAEVVRRAAGPEGDQQQ